MRGISRIAICAAAAALAAVAVPAVALGMAAAAPAALYVNPVTGSDRAPGTLLAPLLTIQQALNEAGPGTVIHLAGGTYSQNVATRTDGTASQPIVIQGPSAGTATLFGTSH